MAQRQQPRGGRPLGSPNRSTSGARPKAAQLSDERQKAMFGHAEPTQWPAQATPTQTHEQQLKSELASVERRLKILTHCHQQLTAEIAALPILCNPDAASRT